MRNLNQYVIERLKINKDIGPIKYNYHPKNFKELRILLKKLLEERGKDADLNDIDVSKVTNFYNNNNRIGLFENLDPHNIDISKWDVSNVKYMTAMFKNCINFNCNLNKWNVSNVEYMQCMFTECKKFTGQGLENWNVSKVKDMAFMFDSCYHFNCNLNKWNVSNVKSMRSMFCECKNFNANLSKWNVSKVQDMAFMFHLCSNFTGEWLDNWKPNFYKCNMSFMFDGCDFLKKYPNWYKK